MLGAQKYIQHPQDKIMVSNTRASYPPWGSSQGTSAGAIPVLLAVMMVTCRAPKEVRLGHLRRLLQEGGGGWEWQVVKPMIESSEIEAEEGDLVKTSQKQQ